MQAHKSSIGSTETLNIDQSKVQHLIFQLSENEVATLEVYSQLYASWQEDGDNTNSTKPPFPFPNLASQIKDTFEKYGVVLVKGLIRESMMDELITAGVHVDNREQKKLNFDTFNTVEFGPVFAGPTTEVPELDSTEEEKVLSAFRTVALQSAIPACISTLLLDLDSSAKGRTHPNLRLLHDVFLAKGGSDSSHCGWHIDDAVFWPCSPRHSPHGVNSWIAMDDIPAKYGGGMAVIPTSHNANAWNGEAKQAIAHTSTHPPEGFDTVGRLFQTLNKTCEIASNAPELNERMEREGVVFDVQKGDVLFMHRFLWHRSVQLTPEGKEYFTRKQQESNDTNQEKIVFKRYTIRYELGSAPLIKGVAMHPSILFDSSNSGKTLDEVVASSGPFFPKCWPRVDEDEMRQLPNLVSVKLPKSQENLAAMMATLRPPMKKE